MPRPTKLDDKLQKQIVRLLSAGVTIKDTCAQVGIHQDTFYDWLKRGEAEEAPFSEFSESVLRAQSAAKVTAIQTIRTAMQPYNQTQTTKKTFSETRLRRDGTEYEYKRTEESKTITRFQGDWRAALEYLKRRYPDEWTDRVRLDDGWEAQAVQDIRAGIITYEALAEAFDRDVATRLFARAGKDIPSGTGAAEQPT